MTDRWDQHHEGGGYVATWLIRAIALYGGRRIARLFLYPITGYFFLRRGAERAASRAFLTRMLGQRPTSRQIMHHMHWLAATMLDRIFFLTHGARDFSIEVDGLEILQTELARGKGMFLVGSHFGSFEALRALAASHHAPLRIVLNTQQTPAQTALLAELAPDVAANIIDGAQDPMSTILAMGEATARGHVVALLADRGRVDETMRRVPFLGSPAPFPTGPWMLATALKVPVVLCLGIYGGGNRYRLVFERLANPVDIPRSNRPAAMHDMLLRYVERIEHYVRLSPYNWFNLYDFWDADDDASD